MLLIVPELSGVYKLLKLFRTDIRYRKSGTGDFIYKLVGILLGR